MERLKFFAAIKSCNDCESNCKYVLNDIDILKSILITECENCFQIEPSWELEDFKNVYHCNFDDYIKLKESNTIEDISRFSFALSDMECYIDLYSNDINEIHNYLESKGFEIEKLTEDNAVSILEKLSLMEK